MIYRRALHHAFHHKLESFEPTLAGVPMKLDPLADYAQQNDLGQEVRSPPFPPIGSH